MSTEEPNSKPLELNLAQWRSDIQTFAKATVAELQSITDQLSTKLANQKSEPDLSQDPLPTPQSTSPQPQPDSRLSRLKEQLESRVKPKK